MTDTTPLTPAEAFATLADETRVTILRVLDDTPAGTSTTFSSLRSAVGVTDSGQFNYHLTRLRPHFVEKTDDGYRLTATGRQVVRAVAAGRFTATAAFETFEHRSTCHRCGTRLHVRYEEERLHLRCPGCDDELLDVGFPSSGVHSRSPPSAVDAFARFSEHQVSQARDGVCPDCSGPTEGSVSDEVPAAIDKPAAVVFRCRVCGGVVVTSFGGLAIYSPEVTSFYRDHGVDLDDRYYWEFPQCLTAEYTDVSSRDPWRATVTFPVDDERCVVHFEGSEKVRVEVESSDG